ncbi:multiple cyclophane-containing RiPP AmcA [Solwaraspora sp. WMMB335]|uniref:multiple cyclophane-containing RiPP AmcA n=1 Tax=Solwaraspora sp. WMMB335 TaxID=3404118 RepID=UPI003B934B61
MPEISSGLQPERVSEHDTGASGPPTAVRDLDGADPVADRVHAARQGLALLLAEAELARRQRDEAAGTDSAVCAWNHFENIPTFYNWNNRPR